MINYVTSMNPFALALIIYVTGFVVVRLVEAVGRTTRYVLEAVREHVREEDRPETTPSRDDVDVMIEAARREWRAHWLADARTIAKEEVAEDKKSLRQKMLPARFLRPKAHPLWEPCYDCEWCGAAMVEKVNRKTGEVFLGCSTYPRCTNSRSA